MKKKIRFILITQLFMYSITHVSMAQSKDFLKYLNYLCGDFDNQKQVEQEIKSGKQIHPLAIHITRVITNRVKNIPSDFKGVFVLEESFYKYPEKDTLAKPYIFMFLANNNGLPILHSMAIPTRIDKKSFRNSNPGWELDFNELKQSPSFSPATYEKRKDGYYINHTVDLPNDMTFTLEETIGKGFLTVMETPRKDGKSLALYDSPILYLKLPN